MGTRGKADVEIAGPFIRGLVWGERTGFGPAKRVHLCTYCCPNVLVPGIASTYEGRQHLLDLDLLRYQTSLARLIGKETRKGSLL